MDTIISLKNVNKYYGDKQVLKNIDLDILPGQVIGYIGPNGAGKSTTVKILCGLIPDFMGDAFIDGINIKTHPLEVKKIIGYIPESAELYDVLTPVEFLSFVASLYDVPEYEFNDRITKMLEAFGLSANVNQRMETFSKGMKQKVLIISSLLHNPKIMFFDEPLSGLDANSVIIVKELIDKLAASGKTIFYSSHMMDIVEKVSDRIILINEGKVIADGSFEDLKQIKGDNSLEQIFSHLTANESLLGVSDKIIDLMK
jgi:ABC-2 type transport system ATP-binding protein